MSNLGTYDPLSIEPAGDLFQGMLRAFRGSSEGGFAFKVDVTESDKAYNLVAEIPGAKKEDIDVSVDRGTVMISAKVEKSSEQKDGERVIRRERYSGSMQRAFTLDSSIDESKVDEMHWPACRGDLAQRRLVAREPDRRNRASQENHDED